jgi:DNA mismatch endonuclease (patch repair protein)
MNTPENAAISSSCGSKSRSRADDGPTTSSRWELEIAPTAATTARFRNTGQRDTPAEIALRQEIHRRGLRYRVSLSVSGLRCRPDIVFRRVRLAIFVDGCYWHSCPLHGSQPTRNASFWSSKLAGNRERDRNATRDLEAAGWDVLRFWEHEVLASPVSVADVVFARVQRNSAAAGGKAIVLALRQTTLGPL